MSLIEVESRWPDFSRGLVPVVVQDVDTGEVLMLAYADEEALSRTIEEGWAWFYSRSRDELWLKGATSGDLLEVLQVFTDCDRDALLYLAKPLGKGACHTGERSCFHRRLAGKPGPRSGDLLLTLEQVLRERLRDMPMGSYTASLYRRGTDALVRKIVEEATEVALAGKDLEADPSDERRRRVVEEAADLVYHLLAYLVYSGTTLREVLGELAKRHGQSTVHADGEG